MKSINKLKKTTKYHLNKFLSKLGLIKSKLSEPKAQWQEVAQEFEFSFHKTNQFRQSEEFVIESNLLFDSFGFHQDDYKGKCIVDLGAGSKMRGKYFIDSKIYIIEPMAKRCLEEIPWCDLNDAEKVYSLPGEEHIGELVNTADFLFSINAIDHGYNFEKIIKNIYSYIKEDGLAFLSFDSHYQTSIGHPLILTEDICNKLFIKNGFKIIKKSKGFLGKYYQVYKRNGYDGSSDCLNYWLKK